MGAETRCKLRATSQIVSGACRVGHQILVLRPAAACRAGAIFAPPPPQMVYFRHHRQALPRRPVTERGKSRSRLQGMGVQWPLKSANTIYTKQTLEVVLPGAFDAIWHQKGDDHFVRGTETLG